MNRWLEWMAANHVAATLLLLGFAVGGLFLSFTVKQEVFPEIALDRVVISVSYPGASPEEVEEGIILKVEESIGGVDGIKEILATAAEGLATISAVVDTGANADRVLQDIKSEVDRITTFPVDAEKPVISKALIRNEVISVVVYGPAGERALRQWAERVRDDLLALPEITQAELVGVRPYEISIELEETTLRRHRLTLEEVAALVRKSSQDIPGGTIKSDGGEILLRTKERRYLGREYEEIVIRSDPGGLLLRLGELATVRDGFEDMDLISRFNGQPAAMVQVFRVGNQKPTEISDVVRRYVEGMQPGLPLSLEMALWNDNTEVLRSRFNLLLKNAVIGLLLVFAILGFFLQFRLALWVMLGLPVSFLGAVLLMPVFDISINMISLFAFIMALGIVVDNSVVVGESIHEQHSRGGNGPAKAANGAGPTDRDTGTGRETSHPAGLAAAIAGTREVAVPVLFSVLTTVAAFVPLLYISGTMGKFISNIPVVLISILLVSLLISLFSLPALLARAAGGRGDGQSATTGLDLSRFANRHLDRLIAGPYRRTLDFCLRYRGLTLAVSLVLLLLAAGLVGGGLLKFRFMPEVEGDIILVELEMPQGTLVTETARIEQFITEQALATVAEFDARRPGSAGILRHVYAVVGATVAEGGPVGGGSAGGTNLANIILLLEPVERREVAATAVAARWRELVGEIPGVRSLTFTTNLVRFGANIDIQLAHDDFATLLAARDLLKADLARYPGVGDIADTFPEGKRELKLRLTPEARSLGLSEEELGRQVRAAFFGAEALRLQRGRNEVKVMVRYPEGQRESVWDLMQLRLRTPDGGEIPLPLAAEIVEGRGFAEINRHDRKRVINITASVDSRLGNAEEILAAVQADTLARLTAAHPGLSYDLEGEARERRESMGSMMQGFALALFAIYALLAIPLRSFGQPLIIMAAIPFGIVGALLGHLLLGYSLSILSLFGIVALSGVVVNNSLLLIDRINKNRVSVQQHRTFGRSAGPDPFFSLREAVIEAGCRRFRPILLTSLTTFFGLFPMILETSVQAQFLIPMAISLGFGVLFSTFITLVLVPTLYLSTAKLQGREN